MEKSIEDAKKELLETASKLAPDSEVLNEDWADVLPIGILVGVYAGMFIAIAAACKTAQRAADKKAVAIDIEQYKEAMGIIKNSVDDWKTNAKTKYAKFVDGGALTINEEFISKAVNYGDKSAKSSFSKGHATEFVIQVGNIEVKKWINIAGLTQKFNINYDSARAEIEKIVNDISNWILSMWNKIASKNEILSKYFTPSVIPYDDGTILIAIRSTEYLIRSDAKALKK